MTAAGQIPDQVLANARARLTAHTRPVPCTRDGCDELATRSACGRPGRWCDTHFAAFGITVPTPDPARTADGIAAARRAELLAAREARP